MKRVLIITYYWPPMGGGGVQRWLKFSKYLRDFGWNPVIYTPSNADISNPDPGLVREIPDEVEVIKRPIWEPFKLYKKFSGRSVEDKIQPGFLRENQSRPLVEKASVWIRGNLFIPDAKKFWIKPSIGFLSKYLKKHPVDAVISTGPPHSNHLIALGLKKKVGIQWLADFRDPWTSIDYYDKLMLSAMSDRKHKMLERKVLLIADEVVTVSWSWANDFHEKTGRLPKVITNGYDPEDFESSKDYEQIPKGDKLTITHIGSLNKDRNPHVFWKVLGELKNEGVLDEENFEVKLIGPTDISVFQSIEKEGLESFVHHIKHLAHREVILKIMESDLLLLPLNNTFNIMGVIPGKLYEYLASRRTIICIGNLEGDTAKIIRKSSAGHVFDFDDANALKQTIESTIEDWKEGRISVNPIVPEEYSRQKLAGEICRLLDQISS